METTYKNMYKYPDGSVKINLPTRQVPGYPIPTKYKDLSIEQLNSLEYFEAKQIVRNNEYAYDTELIWDDNVWTESNVTDPVFREDELFPTYYANKQDEIKSGADSYLAPYAARFAMREEVSWAQQAYEAREWTQDEAFPTPMIDGIISVTGEEKASFCAIVIENETNWSNIAGPVFGKRQVYTDQLNAATTCAEIKAIVVDYSSLDTAG